MLIALKSLTSATKEDLQGVAVRLQVSDEEGENLVEATCQKGLGRRGRVVGRRGGEGVRRDELAPVRSVLPWATHMVGEEVGRRRGKEGMGRRKSSITAAGTLPGGDQLLSEKKVIVCSFHSHRFRLESSSETATASPVKKQLPPSSVEAVPDHKTPRTNVLPTGIRVGPLSQSQTKSGKGAPCIRERVEVPVLRKES